MKRLFLIVGLLLSFSAWGDAIQDWNKKFSELNSVPLNLKWTPSGQQDYYKLLIASKPNYYKNPDNYQSPTPDPTPPVPTPPVPTPPPTPPPTPLPEREGRDLIIKSLLNKIRVDIMTIESYLQLPMQLN